MKIIQKKGDRLNIPDDLEIQLIIPEAMAILLSAAFLPYSWMGTLDDFALPTSMRLPFRELWTKLSESILNVDRCNSLGVKENFDLNGIENKTQR